MTDLLNILFGSLVLLGIYFMIFGGFNYYMDYMKHFKPTDEHPWISSGGRL
jgi:hypothetical protein